MQHGQINNQQGGNNMEKERSITFTVTRLVEVESQVTVDIDTSKFMEWCREVEIVPIGDSDGRVNFAQEKALGEYGEDKALQEWLEQECEVYVSADRSLSLDHVPSPHGENSIIANPVYSVDDLYTDDSSFSQDQEANDAEFQD